MSSIKNILFLFVFLSENLFSQTWQQLADFPATERDDGTAFVIGNKAWCGTGFKTGWIVTNDMYVLDMNTDTWSTATAMQPGTERQYACAFSNNSVGYIFGGQDQNGTALNDLWAFDTIIGNWQQKTSLPDTGLAGACCFKINGIAYIIGGSNSGNNASNRVWSYNIGSDTWLQKSNMSFGGRWRASATELNGKGYLIFGKDQNGRFCKELYEYDPINDTWTQISSFPLIGRSYSAFNTVAGELFVIAGIDTNNLCYNDLWKFDTGTLQWQQQTVMPTFTRKGGICFNSTNAIYYTTGIDQQNNRLKETWKVSNPTKIDEPEKDPSVKIFPNPADCYFETKTNVACRIELYNLFGEKILDKNISEKEKIYVETLNDGVYLLCKTVKSQKHILKLIVQH